jgi:hypothetical protein
MNRGFGNLGAYNRKLADPAQGQGAYRGEGNTELFSKQASFDKPTTFLYSGSNQPCHPKNSF